MQGNHSSIKLYLLFVTVLTTVLCTDMVTGQTNDLREFFTQAQRVPHLRKIFIESYVQQKGSPDYVLEILYSDEVKVFAVTNPLVRTENGSYRTTSHALAIGRGYPSRMTFGPKMFHPAFTYDDFQSVLQHEGAHAKFWASGKLNYLENVDTSENSEVRLKGLFPILFELDALKTQMEQPTWKKTTEQFRKGQEAYRQKWLNKLERLEKQSYTYNLHPLFKRIHRTYGRDNQLN
ncbi:MAG: hypothetical protein P8075_17370 [Deltaproteobacteria bacterium]|jgi:hypothetical protein